ncbi:MAG: hypothetical protein U0871_09065 [Gemmataceae bacterium]
MGRPLLLTLGWLWPFAVSIAGVAVIAAGPSLRNDGQMLLLFFAALLGSPAVVVTIAGWLPAMWSAGPRVGLATVLAIPVVGLELVLASWVLEFGARAAGPGWVE